MNERSRRVSDDEGGPERTCIVTRAKGPPGDLIRFVVSPERTVVADVRARLPGRGAWVSGTHATVADAVRRNAFRRAFKTDVDAPGDLPEQVDRLLERDALAALSLANKAGLVVAGAAKIDEALAKRPAAALIHARDGSADGRRKLEGALRRRMGERADAVPRVEIFSSSQLDLALGRTNVIHAALAGGAACDGFVSRARRLDRYRGDATTAGTTRSDTNDGTKAGTVGLRPLGHGKGPGRTTDE